MKITETTTLNLNLVRPSDTVPVWSVSDRSVCTLVVAEDGQSAQVTPAGQGSAHIDVRSNCDSGSGVCEHHTAFDIEVGDEAVVTAPPVIETPVEVEEVVEVVPEVKTPYWRSL